MISVVSITRNNFSELKDTVESLRGLTGIELVIVNGGDCSDTKAFLESLPGLWSGISVVTLSEKDSGISDAFNKGVRLSSGDSIVFLNSGDTLNDRDYFKRADQFLRDHAEFGFVHGSIVFSDRIAGDIELRPSLSTLGRGMPYRHQTMIVRKSVFDQLGLFRTDLKLTMDYEFVCRMHKAGIKGYYDQAKSLIRMDGGGVSSTKEMQAYSEVWNVLSEHKLLTAENLYGCMVRYAKYFVRRTLVMLGLTNLLMHLKHRKHGKASGVVDRSKRLKIGFALNSIHQYGGLTRSSWELAQYMSKKHDVTFVTMVAELSGTETFHVRLLKVLPVPYLKNVLFAWKISRQKKKLGLDILNVHGSCGLWQDVVTAQSVHKKWFFWSLKQTPAFSVAWIRKLLNPVHYVTIAIEMIQYSRWGSKRVIAISHQVKRDLLDQFPLDPDRVVVIHHGVNTTEFDPNHRQTTRDRMRREHQMDAHQKVIIFAAHEFRRKGLSVLLKAMAKAKDANSLLLVVGQDDPEPFRPLVAELGLTSRVRFLGRQYKMGDWYAASDVFAFPTSYEAFGMVITEAMAAGLPVVVPRDAGAAEFITHDQDGLLLEHWNDIDELASQLDRLDDPQTRARIGLAARKRVESWTWAEAAEKTLETYYDILNIYK